MKNQRQRKWIAFGGWLTAGTAAVASALVLAMGLPFSDDVGRSVVNSYVASIERNDIAGACMHARQAAELYRQDGGNAAVGDGWQVIARAVCPEPAVLAGVDY